MYEFYYTVIVYGIIGALFFIVQLLLCYKAKRMVIKFVPGYFILICFLFTALLYAGVFGTGFLNAHKIVAWLLFIGIGIAFVGDLMAWVIYRIHKRKQLK